MKAYIVTITFKDGGKEGVLFTDEHDAESALNFCEEGSSLAVAWSELYSDTELKVEMQEIEI